MKNKNLLIGIVLLVVIFNSIVYSALNSEMFINGDAHIRVDKDIRITDVKVLEQINGSYETYNSDYSKNTNSLKLYFKTKVVLLSRLFSVVVNFILNVLVVPPSITV